MRNALKVLFVVALAIPTMATAAISNTKHNLTSTNTQGNVYFTDAGVDMCRFCHMPHNANTTQGTLWARPAPTGTGFTSPTATANGTPLPATNAALGSASQKCLSCHDGSVAMNTTVNKFGTYTQVAATISATATGNVTVSGGNVFLASNLAYTNLNGQHPVGIPFAGQVGSSAVTAQYGTATAAGCQAGIPECVSGASAGGAYLKLFANSGGAFQVECGTCHEPHTENVASANPFFLRVPTSVTNGRCGGCHIK